jgi:hypothetical protein
MHFVGLSFVINITIIAYFELRGSETSRTCSLNTSEILSTVASQMCNEHSMPADQFPIHHTVPVVAAHVARASEDT